ncbi:MAG: hypothetical protein DCC68_24210 [Planctomycetota bacterium]|nr:MAG: hypothetical protein DCC68_24210 [Planctomycetota bacterium]
MLWKLVRSFHGLNRHRNRKAQRPRQQPRFGQRRQGVIETLEHRLALAGWSAQGPELQPDVDDFPDFGSGDNIGRSVAIFGDTAVVGVPDDDGDEGAIYIFKRNGTTWTASQRLSPSDLVAKDIFGFAVGISENTIVVGAPQNDSSTSQIGAIYIFERPNAASPFTQVAKRTLTGDSDQFFGRSVAIDGDTIVAGAPWDDFGATDGGSIVIYERDTLTGTWPSSGTKRTASDVATGDSFGNAVAVSGNRIIVGSPLDNHSSLSQPGSAYVFVDNGTGFTQEGKLIASTPAATDRLGSAVDIDGTTAVVGSILRDSSPTLDVGAAFVFDLVGPTWTQTATLFRPTPTNGDQFGASVGIEGNLIAVGAPRTDTPLGNSGSVVVFEHNGLSWAFDEEVLLPGGDAGVSDSELGRSVSIHNASILAGAPEHSHSGPTNNDLGSAYVFVDINDEPFFTPGSNISVAEDSGEFTQANWATGISAGAPNESGQSLQFVVTNNTNPTLFTVGPAISASGTLTFTLADNANGSATITVVLMDDGGTANGGDDTSDPVSFVIDITPVNDAPENSVPGAQSVDEDELLAFLPGDFNSISVSDIDAGSSAIEVTLEATNGTASLSTAAGLVFSIGTGFGDALMTFQGTLADINAALFGATFAPTTNYSGPASLKIITDDLGNTGTGGAMTDEDTIAITVDPVNDAPTANAQNVDVDEDGQVPINLSGTDVETPTGNLTFTILSLPATGLLTVGGVPVQINQTFSGPPALVYEPSIGSGATSATFDFTVTDDGDDSAPGQADETSAAATVTIGISPAVADGTATLVDGVLRAGGGSGNDSVIVSRSGSTWNVSINGTTTTFALATVNEIRIWGRDGNDSIIVDTNISIPATIDAGAGNDVVTGGNGSDLIFGGDGVDLLFGNGGNDMVIGGDDFDFVSGGAGHDVVVAGSVAPTFTAAMLRDVAAAWAAERTATEGVDDGTIDESAFDGNFDILTGGAGADWFIVNIGDWIIDYRPNGVNGDLITQI